MRQCICQICVCGRHHCEHKKTHRVPYAKDKDDGIKVSEHKDRYRYCCYQTPELPIKPTGETCWKGDEPPVKISTTKKDYVPFPIQRRTMKRPKTFKEHKGKMACDTTYKNDYKPKKGHVRSKFKGADSAKDGIMPGTLPGRMVDETTYGRSYTPKSCPQREQAKAKECTLTELGKPFTGETETRLCYKPQPFGRRESMRPKKGQLEFVGDFDGTTTHATDYLPKYQAPRKPIKKLSKWKPESTKFEGETTHAHDFRCPDQTPRQDLYIPKSSLLRFSGPFEGVSHYKKDYPAHDICRRKLPKWHPSLQSRNQSEAPMAGETTYKTDYEPPPEDQVPYKSNPIRNNLTIPTGPMEKVTTNMRDYRRIDHPIFSRSCKPDTEYKKPEGKFSDCTTTRCDYTLKTGERAETTKQADNLGFECGPMEDLTTAMRDFQGMYLDCPAKYLKLYGKDALPQFKFEKTEKGHDFFKKLKKPKKL